MLEQPAVTIDMSGMPCPAPLLGAKKIIDMVLTFLFGALTMMAISWLKDPK